MTEFGAKRKVIVEGEEVTVPATVSRISRNPGADRRQVIVSLCDGDVITLREFGRRKEYSVTVKDLHWILVRRDMGRTNLEKARERKSKLTALRARRRIARAETKLRRELRTERGEH